MADLLYVSVSPIPTELAQLLKRAGYHSYDLAKSAGEARRLINLRQYDEIIIASPLPDELGDKLALDIALDTSSNIIFIAKPEVVSLIEFKMESNGIVVFAKPVSGSLLYKVLTIFKAVDRRMSVVLEKNKKLEDRIEEIKLVSRAKMILMSKMGISEEEAHKHLDKTAKDQRKTKREIALAIIQMYE